MEKTIVPSITKNHLLFKKSLAVLIGFFIFHDICYGQKGLSPQGEKVENRAIYLTFDGKKLEYFSSSANPDERSSITEKVTFSLKNKNSCNIYLKWINPLKYKVSWQDSVFTDERDQKINDFIGLLVAQFGEPVTSLNKVENNKLIAKSKGAQLPRGSTDLSIPASGFNNSNLTFLYITLRENQDDLMEDERKQLNELTKLIEDLDTKNAVNLSQEVDQVFKDLLAISDPNVVPNLVLQNEAQIKKFESLFTEIEGLQKDILKGISELTISDNLLNSYSKTVITSFITQTKENLKANKSLVSKLKPIINIVKSSVNEPSSNSKTSNFYRIREVGFEEGQKFQTLLSFTEFEYESENKDFEKKELILARTIAFEKYDIVNVTVSTGIFFSNTELSGYGVSTDETGELVIVEDNISENDVVTAVFLNLNLGIGSRYFAPLIQLGIAPTKTRPFLLAGLGFTIPSAKIAFSGGPIWTWNPTLNELSNGQQVSSTIDLEKDIRYQFDVSPKGWYLGIQYNF